MPRLISTYSCDPLMPYMRHDGRGYELPVNLTPDTTFERGRLLSLVGAIQNEIHTITNVGSITAGTFLMTGTHPLTLSGYVVSGLAYNVSNANLKAAIEAALGLGVTVTIAGSGLPGNATTITYGGSAAGLPVAPPTIGSSALVGGTLSLARTTTGRTAGTYMPYKGVSLLTAPSTAPTVAGNGSGSSFAAGSYLVAYTYVTALGESTPSIPAVAVLTSGQNVRVSAISSIPTGVTKVRFYVNGVLVAETAVSSGSAAQTDITGGSLTLMGASAPITNAAYVAASGATVPPLCVLKYACATDTSGMITFGAQALGDECNQNSRTATAYFGGHFLVSEIVGLDQYAIAALDGRIASGSGPSAVFVF